MEAWQESLIMQGKAICIEVEGMEAENAQRKIENSLPTYVEQDFMIKAQEMIELSRELVNQ